jgi:hypothetical protein
MAGLRFFSASLAVENEALKNPAADHFAVTAALQGTKAAMDATAVKVVDGTLGPTRENAHDCCFGPRGKFSSSPS